VSTEGIDPSSDGYVEFGVVDTSSLMMAGLSQGDTDQTYQDIDYALYIDPNGYAYVFESGAYQGALVSYQSGDRFRVGIQDGMLQYVKNGVVFHQHPVALTNPLVLDTSLYFANSTVSNAIIAGVLSQVFP
jgi:hypothetical protein